MSSGWGSQFLGKNGDVTDWCMKLHHVCEPGCKGCIIAKEVTFSQPQIDEEQEKKVKNQSDNPLGERGSKYIPMRFTIEYLQICLYGDRIQC